jgi:hypothetical protein
MMALSGGLALSAVRGFSRTVRDNTPHGICGGSFAAYPGRRRETSQPPRRDRKLRRERVSSRAGCDVHTETRSTTRPNGLPRGEEGEARKRMICAPRPLVHLAKQTIAAHNFESVEMDEYEYKVGQRVEVDIDEITSSSNTAIARAASMRIGLPVKSSKPSTKMRRPEKRNQERGGSIIDVAPRLTRLAIGLPKIPSSPGSPYIDPNDALFTSA